MEERPSPEASAGNSRAEDDFRSCCGDEEEWEDTEESFTAGVAKGELDEASVRLSPPPGEIRLLSQCSIINNFDTSGHLDGSLGGNGQKRRLYGQWLGLRPLNKISVGLAGTTNKTVKVSENFTLKTPGPGYTCGRAIVGRPTKFFSADGRRVTQDLMIWNVTCTYSQFLAQKTLSCCVSLSSFYNDTIVNCPTCSCGCQNPSGSNYVNEDSPNLQAAIDGPGKWTGQPLVQCTSHMCPIRIHWHVKLNYKEY
ncbi:COBRA-like protein 3 [Zea mays]|nr:COBRA-like protein 3 [Zea mays]